MMFHVKHLGCILLSDAVNEEQTKQRKASSLSTLLHSHEFLSYLHVQRFCMCDCDRRRACCILAL